MAHHYIAKVKWRSIWAPQCTEHSMKSNKTIKYPRIIHTFSCCGQIKEIIISRNHTVDEILAVDRTAITPHTTCSNISMIYRSTAYHAVDW